MVHEWSKSGQKAGKNKGKAFSEGDVLISGYQKRWVPSALADGVLKDI